MANRFKNVDDGTGRQSRTPVAPAQDPATSSMDPVMEDWRKAFGDKVPPAVGDFLEYRHREWELGIGSDLKARPGAPPVQSRKKRQRPAR